MALSLKTALCYSVCRCISDAGPSTGICSHSGGLGLNVRLVWGLDGPCAGFANIAGGGDANAIVFSALFDCGLKCVLRGLGGGCLATSEGNPKSHEVLKREWSRLMEVWGVGDATGEA